MHVIDILGYGKGGDHLNEIVMITIQKHYFNVTLFMVNKTEYVHKCIKIG